MSDDVPTLTTVLAQRNEELRLALTAIYQAVRDDGHDEWWTMRGYADSRGIFTDDIGDTRWIAAVAKYALEHTR